jgi:hypothetical protein
MKLGKGRLQRKGITSLSIITQPAIILAAIFCIIALQQELPSLFKYVASGSSFFLPAIPAINLLGFLPGDIRGVSFTLGNLVDITIDIYVFLSVGIIPYRWHRSARESGFPVMDMQLINLIHPADFRVRPRVFRSCAAQGHTRMLEKDVLYSGLARMDDRCGEALHSGSGYHASSNHSGMTGDPGNTCARAHRFPVGFMAPKARKAPVSVIAAPAFACFSLSAFNPYSRALPRGADEGRLLFLSKTRAMVTGFSIVFNKWMET